MLKTSLLALIFSFSTLAFAQKEQFFTSFDGTNIHYSVQGDGPAVILIHGFIVDSDMWKNTPIKISLLDAGYQVVTIDLRGNGLSDKPHSIKLFENDAEVHDIMALMENLNISKYYAIGYSRGAIIAAKLLTLDKNVKAAVLGGMGTDFTNPDWPRKKMFAEAFAGKAHLYPETQGAVAYAKSIGADTLCLSLMQQAQPVTSQKQLKSIRKPVLVISGDKDMDNGKASDLANLLKKSTLKTVSGTHNSVASSSEFAVEILQFLQSLQ